MLVNARHLPDGANRPFHDFNPQCDSARLAIFELRGSSALTPERQSFAFVPRVVSRAQLQTVYEVWKIINILIIDAEAHGAINELPMLSLVCRVRLTGRADSGRGRAVQVTARVMEPVGVQKQTSQREHHRIPSASSRMAGPRKRCVALGVIVQLIGHLFVYLIVDSLGPFADPFTPSCAHAFAPPFVSSHLRAFDCAFARHFPRPCACACAFALAL